MKCVLNWSCAATVVTPSSLSLNFSLHFGNNAPKWVRNEMSEWHRCPFAASIQLHSMNWMTCCALLSQSEIDSCCVALPSRSIKRANGNGLAHALGHSPSVHTALTCLLHFIQFHWSPPLAYVHSLNYIRWHSFIKFRLVRQWVAAIPSTSLCSFHSLLATLLL